ncbi:MAG: ATP-dependent RNA helicase RhlB [Hyphomicrobiaceae bacterium]
MPEQVRRGIEEAGFETCTPIQAESLPIALQGRDVAGQAQTGTGKTAAFLIAIYSLLLRNPRRYQGEGSCPRALIIAPTRELAMQIRDEAELLGKYTGLRIQAVFGGVDYGKQGDLLRDGVDVLIGTPGRLIDYFKQGFYTLSDTEVFVADEADRMFDMGFIDDLRYMMRNMAPPAERVSFLYSATLSFRVLELAYEYMNEATRVAIDEGQITAERVEQVLYHVGMHEKLPLLVGLLEKENPDRALIFVNTRSGASRLADILVNEGYDAAALVGDLDQKKRIKLLHRFKEHQLRILVATDVASRGLHIDAVTHVFNYDLPQDPEDYVHRIGRTARAGASGRALSLACERYVYGLEPIQELLGKPIPCEAHDESILARLKPLPRRPPRDTPSGRDGRRGGRSDGGERRDARRRRKPGTEEDGGNATACGAGGDSTPSEPTPGNTTEN